MAARIPDSIIDEVNRRTDIVEVVGSYVNLSRKGHAGGDSVPSTQKKLHPSR